MVLIAFCSDLEDSDVAHLELVLEFSDVCQVVYLVDDGHQVQDLLHVLIRILSEGCNFADVFVGCCRVVDEICVASFGRQT